MCQVHHHRPESTANDCIFLWKLGDRYDSICQFLLAHYTASLDVFLHEFLVAMVTLVKSYLELFLAEIVIRNERRLCHHHPVFHIFHRNASARCVGHRIVIGLTRVGVHVDAAKQLQCLVNVCCILKQVLRG